KYDYLTAAQANAAFDAALAAAGLTTSHTLDLSTAADRAKIFTVINTALGNLEKTLGFSFSEVTLQQL
ncbi:MAG: chitin-binding protein, partial [Chthoniobacterales bacterium]